MATILLDNMDYFRQDASFYFPQREEELRWAAWYNNNYTSLLPTSTIENGGKLFAAADRINLPMFKVASDFLANAALSELPSYSVDDEASQEWLDDNFAMIHRTLRRATVYWSIADRAVFVAEPGVIRAVEPYAYFRVGEPDLRDNLVGHILAYPYYEKTPQEQLQSQTQYVPNRILVQRFSIPDNINDQTVYELNGSIIGRVLSGPERTAITAVCIAGGGNGWYQGVKDVAARLILQMSNIDAEINRWRNRPWYVTPNLIDAVTRQLEALGQTNTPTALFAAARALTMPVIGVDMTDGEDVPIDPNPALDLTPQFQQFNTLLDIFWLNSGLPPSSFGIGVGRNESGIAKEMGQTGAGVRIGSYRIDLADCLKQTVIAAGLPNPEGLSFTFITSPFQNRAERAEELLKQLSAGVLAVSEVRTALGYSSEKPSDETQQAEPQEEENMGIMGRIRNAFGGRGRNNQNAEQEG